MPSDSNLLLSVKQQKISSQQKKEMHCDAGAVIQVLAQVWLTTRMPDPTIYTSAPL